MIYRPLGQTNIQVSAICLGTMTWGQQNSQEEAFAQLDYALSQGINFIDTAELYAIPPKAETYGKTETIIGNWLKERQCRDKIILASKVCGDTSWVPHIRQGKSRLQRQDIQQAVDASLQRLQTDYIDLYQVHWPQRQTNFFGRRGFSIQEDENWVSIAETIDALSELVQQGKVRHIGISNETPWGMMQYLKQADQGKERIVSIQNPYGLLNRLFEVGLSEMAMHEQVGLLAYSPLGFGVLSGKYLQDQQPANARMTLFDNYRRYSSPQAQQATEAYVHLAQQHGLSPSQMALAFVHQQHFVTSTIIGATTMNQLKENIDSIYINLSDSVMQGIEEIHNTIPDPSP
ncbi:MAG: NADP(H)-dependent aldo-keto reductase [Mariprofundaceae bacterium]|nr:NADP(H)-dependent aldo-keto reductase [Mariprofundaceae bacterium]